MQHENDNDGLDQLWRARLWLFAGAVIGLISAFVYLSMATPYYKARIVVGPVPPDAQTGANYAPNTTGSARMGLLHNVQQHYSQTPDFLKFEQQLHGKDTAALLLNLPDARQIIEADPRFERTQSNGVADLRNYLQKYVLIDPVGQTPLRRISYAHPDAGSSEVMLEMLHRTIDNAIRFEIKKQLKEKINYLDKQILGTVNADHKNALIGLLTGLKHREMMAEMSGSFAAQIFTAPASSAEISWPRPVFIYPSFAFSGMLLAFFAFGLRQRIK